VDPGEQCDDGNGILDDDCPDGVAGTCTNATCGDGFTNLLGTQFPNEECDDGNAIDNDACANDCTLPATCGDSSDPDPQVDLNGGEACDSGTAFNSDTTPGDCTTVCRTDCTCPACGDGVTDYQLGEECDDRNTVDNDGCSSTCQLEVTAACGNGILEPNNNENCDDGNNNNGDGCSSTCQLETVGGTCGDSNDPQPKVDVDTDEVCDEGLQVCADGTTICTQNTDCPAGPNPPQLCLTANGDLCNTTCNFDNIADTFHMTGDGGITITADNTYLWYADELNGELSRLDVQACIDHHANTATPCFDASGGPPPNCPDPCTAQLLVTPASPTLPGTNTMHLYYAASDGDTVWFGGSGGVTCNPATEVYLYEMDIAACDAALGGGASDCNGLEAIVAGNGIGHVDGFGTAAQLSGLRGITYYAGYVYFLDGGCGTLRRYDPGTTEVKTVIGDPTCPGGQAFQEGYGGILPGAGGASLNSPRYMATDHSGFLYISDNFDHTISRYNVVTSYLERFVGNPGAGPGYADNYDGTLARFDRPRDITSDGTSIYVADFDNYTIRQVDILTGRVTTMVGVPDPNQNPDNKCDLLFGQGAAPGTGPQFHKPLELAYHYPSGSLFFYTGGTGGAGCYGPPSCTTVQLKNQIWRIR
jgi:cysteine-rich repeat protein